MQELINEIEIDNIGLSVTQSNWHFKMKFITVRNHLANTNFNSFGSDMITPHGHPVTRIIKKFQKNLHLLIHQKL